MSPRLKFDDIVRPNIFIRLQNIEVVMWILADDYVILVEY